MDGPPQKHKKGLLRRPDWSRKGATRDAATKDHAASTGPGSNLVLPLSSHDQPHALLASTLNISSSSARAPRQTSVYASTSSDLLPAVTGSSDVSEAALVSALLARVVVKLPIHTGALYGSLERDEDVAHVSASLQSSSKANFSLVAQPLLSELEALTKPPFHSESDFLSLDLLRSQLFLLALLTRCLYSHWAAFALSRHPATTPTTSIPIIDPAPLDDGTARQLLALAVGFIRGHAGQDDELSSINAELATDGLVGADTSVGFLAQRALETEMTSQRGLPSGSSTPLDASAILPSRQSASTELVHHASKVVYFLSASNFGSVLSRIKSRVLHPAGSDELPTDGSELRVLECCYLDRRRASLVIQELCNTFIHLKRPLQASVSSKLQRALSSFISSSSLEFGALNAANRRLEGGPEVLFDIIYTLSEGSKKKDFCWPVMASLLTLCPDIVGKLVVGEGARSPGVTKKVQFLEALRKALKGKGSEVAALCYSELARAAGLIEPDDEDPSALRLLVADFELDLKAALFDPRKPFMPELPSSGALTTRTLVALYRLNPSSVIESVFAPLLRSDAHEKQKAAALGAVLVLFKEGKVVPWTPSALALLPSIARSMRQLFLDTSTLPLTPPSRRPSSRAHHAPTRSSHEQAATSSTHLLRTILLIWSADPRFLAHGVFRPPDDAPPNQPGAGDSLSRVLLAVVGLLEVEHVREVRRAAVGMLSKLLSDESEEVVSARDGPGFEIAALPVSFGLSKYVVEAASDDEQSAIEVLLQDLRRLRLLLSHPPSTRLSNLLSQSSGWSAYWTSLEIALLTVLSTSDSQNPSIIATVLQQASALLDDFGSFGGDGQPQTVIPVLAVAASHDQDQSAMWSRLSTPTTGLVAAWDEAMRRWKEASSFIFGRIGDGDDDFEGGSVGHRRDSSEATTRSTESQLEEWIDLTSFLLATSSLCVDTTGVSPLEAVLPAARYPARFLRRSDRARQIERLVQELVDLLVSDSTNIRDSVRSLLGTDLPPHQLPYLLSHLEQISRLFHDNSGPVTEEAFTLFIVQVISVLLLIFAREQISNPTLLAPQPYNTLCWLLGSFALYLSRLDNDPQNYRRKIQLAELCSVVFAVHGRSRQSSSSKCNRILKQLAHWTSSETVSSKDASEERLYEDLRQDLRLACLKAMVPLLDGLVVHSSDDLDHRQETDPRVFNRYFAFFTLSLHRLGDDDPALSSTKEAIVGGLANLLTANLSAARLVFNEMSLAPDVASRAVYLDALAKAADQGIRFDQLAPVDAESDTFVKLVQLMRQPGPLAITLCHVASAAQFEDLIEIILKVFSNRKVIARFLKAVIEMEVSVTDHESTLFRGNSFATRILTVYARSRGYHYLRDTLKDLLLTLCQKPPEFSMDFDPHRQTAADDVASRNLEQVTEAFLVCISQSINQVPPAIREICSHIGEVVGERFPESVFTAIGGFIFLRFINPAIVSPETIDLDLPLGAAGDNREIRRGLVMITKVLQALANNVRFGSKEPGMKKLNEFMDVQVFAMTRFLQAIAHYSPADEAFDATSERDEEDSDSTLDEADRSFLHQYLSDHSEQLGVELLRGKHAGLRYWQEGVLAVPSATGQATWAQLTDLIAALGSPPEAAARAAAAQWEASPEQAFSRFMARNDVRASVDGREWESVFYEVAGNKNGNVTFCLVLERIKADTAELESLVYFILKNLSNVSEPFEVLIDATSFSQSNEIAPIWIAQLVAIAPATLTQQLARVVIFSCNSVLRRYLRRLNRSMSLENLDARRIVAISTLSDLEQQFGDLVRILPASSILLARETRSQFTQITERHRVKVEHPVVFRVGAQSLVISTAKRQELFMDVRAGLNDIIQLRDIEEIRKVTMGVEGDGLSIKVAGERDPRRFLVNVRREEIFKALVDARKAAPAQPSTFSRDYAPEAPTAIVINAVLVNLCSSSETVRSCAHRLLSSINRSRRLEGFDDLRGLESTFVPSGHLSYLTVVSERLAAAFPDSALDVVSQIAASLPYVASFEAATYVHCLRPWLHHLSAAFQFTPRSEREAVLVKMTKALRQLIRASMREPAVHTSLTSRVWPTIGKLDFLLPLVLEECVRLVKSFEAGSDGDPSPLLGEILIALSAGQGLRGKLLARLRQCLTRTALKPVLSLNESPEWPEMTALIRLDLPLSFDVKPHVYLPELCHIIVSLCCTGSLPMRRSVHALLLNTIHGLAKDVDIEENTLRATLEGLSGDKGRSIFGLDPLLPDFDVLSDGEVLVRALVQVIEVAAPYVDTANAWRARWTSLATAACFQHNLALQARQFLVLSFLGASAIDGDLVFQILTTLRSAIRLSSLNYGELAIVIIRTLVSILPGLLEDSPFWSGLGWLSVALLQIGRPSITAAAIPLLSIVVEGMQHGGYFSQRPLVETFLDFRQEDGPESIANALDDAAGIDTEISFSFALATLLVNALVDPATAVPTIALLLQLLRYARLPTTPNGVSHRLVTVEEDAMPFFLLLLPTMAREGRLEELLDAAGLESGDFLRGDDLSLYRSIALRLGVISKDSAFLAFALLIALGQEANDPLERVALFALLERLSISHPEVSSIFHAPLVPILSASISAPTASNAELEAVQAVLRSQSSTSTGDHPTADQILDQLHELGFPALAHVGLGPIDEGSEVNPEQIEISHLTSDLLSAILSAPH